MASERKRKRIFELSNKGSIKRRKLSIPNNEHSNEIISRLDAKHYSITYIVGESGIGKTTILNKLHQQRPNNFHILSPNELKWNKDESVVSHFKNHHNLLNYVGLGSIRSRLSNFQNLSEGEKYRVITARLIKDAMYSNRMNPSTDYLVLDEFTSVLDRDTSKSLSYSISKFVRSNKKNNKFQTMCRIILCSAHCDLIPYLQPDLVIKLNKNGTIHCIENPKLYKFWPNVDTKAIINFNELPDLADWKQNKLKIESIHTYSNSEFDKNRNWDKLEKTFKLKHKVKVDQWTKDASLPFDYEHNGINQMELVKVTKSDIAVQSGANVCIIYGPSGSGKTTTAKRLFDEYDGDHALFDELDHLEGIYSNDELDEELYNAVEWNEDSKVCEKMICGRIHQMEILNAVDLDFSFAQRKYFELSVGEQHRVGIAVTLSHVLKDRNNKNKWYIVDEFTSFLDRDCAAKCVIGINEFIQRYELKNIAFLTCHYDIVQFFDDSIIIDLMNRRISLTQKSKFECCELQKKREFVEWDERIFKQAKLRIHVKQAKPEDFNPIFGIWHYKTKKIETRALCLGAFVTFYDEINGKSEQKLIGFTSILTANPYEKAKLDRWDYRLHRTVVLPQLNGMGIGSRISECFAEYLLHQKEKNKESLILHSKTAHPFYGKCRMNNILWKSLENCGTKRALIGINYSKDKEKENKAPNNMKKKEKNVPKIYYNFHYRSLNERENNPQIQKKLDQRLIVIKKNSLLQKLGWQ